MKTYLISFLGERHEDRIPLSIVFSNEDEFLASFILESQGEDVTEIKVEESDYNINAKFLYTENGFFLVEEFNSN